MTNKITNILGYESNKTGANAILKFNSGWITKRKLTNVITEHVKRCALSGKDIPVGVVCYVTQIKKRGYSTYWLSQEAVNEALNGEYSKKAKSADEEKEPVAIVETLLVYLDELQCERKEMIKEDKELRAALANIKFKNSKLGAKMSATHKLLELVSVKK